jgi:lysophospholipid acyltransferase (LPLAT)-like uncharacterized protein
MPEAAKSGAEREKQPQTTHYDTRLVRLPLSRRIQVPVIAGAALALVRLIGPTLRFEEPGYQHVERVYAGGRRCIFTFWHRGGFPLMWRERNRSIAVLTSTNFDGQWAGRVTRGMGMSIAYGSSTRGGLRGLAELAERMAKGQDAAFSIDGPHGPRYVAKPGPVLLARQTGCPILCFHAYSEHAYTFKKAWDLFQIPYPFSRVVMVFGPPIEVPPDADREAIERKHAEMQRLLERVRDAAESWFALSPAERERERALWNA